MGEKKPNEEIILATMHRAYFDGTKPLVEAYFIRITNLSKQDIWVTNVGMECRGEYFAAEPPERPLPRKLELHEPWETWIEFDKLPTWIHNDPYRLGRVTLSTGETIETKQGKYIPSRGEVPGGPVRPDYSGAKNSEEQKKRTSQEPDAMEKGPNAELRTIVPDRPYTRLDVYKRWILDHKILSIVILIGVLIISVGAFSDGVWKMVDSYKRVVGRDRTSESEASMPLAISDELKVTKVRPIMDQPTNIRDSSGTGIMSLYWELVLSNNGEEDLSVIGYDVLQLLDKGPISYNDLRQGLYFLQDTKLQTVKFPMVIPAGHSSAVFIRLGVMMHDKAFAMVKEEFNGKQPQNASSIVDFLRSREIDVFGNPFTKSDVGLYSLPPIDQIQDPVFGVSFKTARNTETTVLISWYRYGLYRLATEYERFVTSERIEGVE